MATETVKLVVDNSNALRGINQVTKSLDGLNSKLSGLRNVLGGLAIGNFVRQTLLFADSIDDLSQATGIATSTILGFTRAVQQNGGNAENAQAAINKLVLSIGDAADGSKAAQVAFAEVGVSLDDLRMLSEEDIFKKTLQGLAQIDDVSKRARLQNELLGKSLRGVNIGGVVGGLGSATAGVNAAAIKSGADAYQKLSTATGNLQEALLNIIKPINDFITKLDLSVSTMEKLIYTLATFGIALAALKISSLVAGLLATYTRAQQVASVFGLLISILRALGGIIVATVGVLARFAGFVGVLLGVVQAMDLLGKAIFGYSFIDAFIDKITPAIEKTKEWYRELRNSRLAIALLGPPEVPQSTPLVIQGQGAQAAPPGFDSLTDYFKKRREDAARAKREVEDAFAKESNAIRQVTEAYKEQNAATLINLQRQLQAMSLSEDAVEIENARNEVLDQSAEQIRQLTERQRNLTGEDLKYWGVIQQQIDAIRVYSQVYADASEEIVRQVQKRRQEERDLGRDIELRNQSLQMSYDISLLEDQIALLGSYGEQLQIQEATLAVTQELRGRLLEIDKAQNELIKQRTKLGEEEFQKQMQHLEILRQKAYEYADTRLLLEEELYEKQRAIREDWQAEIGRQLEDLAESISPARMAADMFGSVINSVDNALTQFVEKGKFNFKDFTRSILRDMALIIARALIMRTILSLFGMGGFSASSSAMAFNYTGPQFGGFAAKGGNLAAGKSYVVGELGPELFIPKTAGTIIPNNQLAMAGGGGGTVVNYNINAVDAQSFRSLVARDPQFIYNITEVGRRSSPARRLS